MALFKYLFIHYHNHHLQKQCTDMAPRVLEQMSQTVTPLTCSPFFPPFTLTFTCYSCTKICTLSTRPCMHPFHIHSRGVASATSPITLARACMHSFSQLFSPSTCLLLFVLHTTQGSANRHKTIDCVTVYVACITQTHAFDTSHSHSFKTVLTTIHSIVQRILNI